MKENLNIKNTLPYSIMQIDYLGSIPEKDTMTTILKIISAVFLVMNAVRLGMDLHGKVVKNNILREKKNLEQDYNSFLQLHSILHCFVFFL